MPAERTISNANTPSGVAAIATADYPDPITIEATTAPLEAQPPYASPTLPAVYSMPGAVPRTVTRPKIARLLLYIRSELGVPAHNPAGHRRRWARSVRYNSIQNHRAFRRTFRTDLSYRSDADADE